MMANHSDSAKHSAKKKSEKKIEKNTKNAAASEPAVVPVMTERRSSFLNHKTFSLFSANMKTYVLLGLVLVLLFLSYLIVKPFLITVLTAVIVALIFNPIHQSINRRIGRPSFAALVSTFLVFLIIVVPASFFVAQVGEDAYSAYTSLQTLLVQDSLSIPACEGDTRIFCLLSNGFNNFMQGIRENGLLREFGLQARSLSISYGSDLLRTVLSFVFKTFIFVLVLFYLFRDGQRFTEYRKKSLPLAELHKYTLIAKANETLYAVLYGVFLTGMLQAVLATILYLILGLPSPFFLGLLTFIGGITIGTWIVWAPAGIWFLAQGLMTENNPLIIKGIVLLAIRVTLISMLDNVLRPYLIGRKTTVPIPLIIIGLLGGLQLFGLVGIFLGPIILALLIVTVNLATQQ